MEAGTGADEGMTVTKNKVVTHTYTLEVNPTEFAVLLRILRKAAVNDITVVSPLLDAMARAL